MAELIGTSLFADANLQAYYRLADANDSKNSNTLTNNNTVAFNAALFGNGGDLGASNADKYLSRAANIVAGTSDLSVSFWVKLQTEIGAGYYTFTEIDTTTGADRYFSLAYNYNTGTRRLELDVAGTLISYNITMGTSLWYHIVAIRNVGGGVTKLYVDNVERAAGAVGTTAAGATRYTIGAHPNPTNFASAIFDDFAIFNKVLSVAEIATLYNPAAGGGALFAL